MQENRFIKFIPVLAVILFFVGFGLWVKFGPAIPLTISQNTVAQPAPFTVSAEGKVFAKPDIAQVSVGFTSSGPTVSDVQNQANQIINNVSLGVKRLGIGEKDIQTVNYNLRQDYERRGNFVIDVTLQIKVRDFAKINQVIDVSTQNGANTIGNLNFAFDDIEKYKSQARKLAIDEARRKASEIANESGITLGKIINVSEGSYDYPRAMPMMAKAEVGLGGGAPTQIEAGSSEITVTVTLSYETR